ncbi:MAG TPA: S9 family peptidase [Pyrinomonadaceae bacterium]
MKKNLPIFIRQLLAFSVIFSFSLVMAQTNVNPLKPPVAKKIPKTAITNGDKRIDNYFWLREKKNPAVMKYLEAENAYADAFMKPTEGLQQTLYKEMVAHLKETDVDVPYREGDYFYYSRTEKGKQYPIYCRKRESLAAAEEVLLDLNEMARGLEYFDIGALEVSDDGQLLAYTTDTTGYRQYTLQVKDLRTGKLFPEKIERVNEVVWATDNKTLFYTTEDDVTKRHDKFYRHALGSKSSELIYNERDELYDIEAARSLDKAFIFLTSESKLTTEVLYIPSARPNDKLKVISPRQNDHKYFADHRGDLFYIRTNQGGKNYRIVTAPVAAPQQRNWKEIMAHRPTVKLDDIDLFANYMVVSEYEKGLEQIEVIDLRKKGRAHRVEFSEPVYSASLGDNHEFNTDVLRFDYESLVTPDSVFDYDMTTKERKLLKQKEVPGYDPSLYTSERAFATATDGTQIPISIVYKKGLKMDGHNPTLLYGYGSYGYSISPTFSSNRVSLLERGVVYAIAHIRGGGEMGEDWREQGRMMFKKNTFTDFISSAEYLIKQNYTSRDRLAIEGGSAGGLLMGAVTNMRPDLFKAVLAEVPFVDVVNTMLDASLPLTTSEYLEWGNPNQPRAYRYIKSYSPYDNIKAQGYPSMLVKVSLNDSQVPYWEGTKFVAKLRATKTDNNPLLLKVNMGAGHGGASGRYDALLEKAFDYAFLLTQMGINQ